MSTPRGYLHGIIIKLVYADGDIYAERERKSLRPEHRGWLIGRTYKAHFPRVAAGQRWMVRCDKPPGEVGRITEAIRVS